MIRAFLSQPWIVRLGWALLHFLWQGTAIALVYAGVRRVFARALSPRGEYCLSCTTLGFMAVAPALTFLAISGGVVVPAHGEGWNISSAEAMRLLPILVFLWAVGVALFSIRLFGAWRLTRRLRSIAHPASPEWQQRLEKIALRVAPASPAHIRRARLMISSLVDVPTVIGWLRPVIMTPVAFLSELPVNYVEALLAHELAHIRRHDYIASILQNIIEAVLFYHPAVWWVSGQIRAEREVCCDDLVIAATSDAATYARALTSLESRQVARAGLQLAANGGTLLSRIRRLVEPNARPNDLPGTASAGAMVLLWALGAGVAAVHGAPAVVAPQPVSAIVMPDGFSKPSPYSAPLLFDPVFPVQIAQSKSPETPAPPAAPAANAPAFELADVHVSAHSDNPSLGGGYVRNGRYELRSATMVDLIGRAYGLDGRYVLGGPSWLDTDRFDVIGSVPQGSTPDMLEPMLRALLADRFKLVVHKDSKPVQAWVLAAGKHLLIQRSDGSGDGGCERERAESTIINAVMSCQNATMTQFVGILRIPNAQISSYLGDYPVEDSTDLKGSWNFRMKWTGRGALADAGSEGVTLFDAIDKQLGLKLELQPTPLPVVIVDSVNRTPTANLPGVTEKLPDLPTEFEVADIKLSTLENPTRAQLRAQFQPGGRFSIRGITLMALVAHAWDIDNYDGMIVGAPKWMNSDRFDIVAQVAPPDGPSGVLKDDDTFRLMLRQLLKDRFKMAIQTEDQPVTVYALVAANPKLKKADPSNRTGCKYTGAVGSGEVLARMSTWNCQNMSMSQLADWLPQRAQAQGWLDHPVIDESGIEGAWDFTLTYSDIQAFQTSANGRSGGADPNGAVSIFEAIEKQLGLKLQTQKHPMPVLVIDHVERQPSDN